MAILVVCWLTAPLPFAVRGARSVRSEQQCEVCDKHISLHTIVLTAIIVAIYHRLANVMALQAFFQHLQWLIIILVMNTSLAEVSPCVCVMF